MEILDDLPIIFTKDKTWWDDWKEKHDRIRPGMVMLLPEDAVLAMPPRIVGIEMPKLDDIVIPPGSIKHAGGGDLKRA